ncbi:MAG: discoidin domain-containing protein, partial [Clostridia bacterium]|nr:discoidin domain-containing protein [Clostridia bacterium]
MKRYIRLFLALVLILCTSLTIHAAYPASTSHGCFKPEEGILLEGTLIGTPSWSGGSGDSYDKAWDGDPYTYYDPQNGASDASYTGIETDEPYVLTEVRILPREGWLDRFEGAQIQGSSDGEEWYTVWESKMPAKEWKYACYTGVRIDCPPEGYTMFRYV